MSGRGLNERGLSQAEVQVRLDQLIALRDLVQVEAAREIAVAQAQMSQVRAVANARIGELDGQIVALMVQRAALAARE